jgi:hypothetical protein
VGQKHPDYHYSMLAALLLVNSIITPSVMLLMTYQKEFGYKPDTYINLSSVKSIYNQVYKTQRAKNPA